MDYLILKIGIRPLSWLYGLILWIRHWLYDRGLLFSKSFNQPIIKIGNLSFGGTGKTPMTIFIAKYLEQSHSISILSRGYSRSSSGFLEVLKNSNVNLVGDEPLLLKQRLPITKVYVCESRVAGIEKINAINQERGVIILDDAIQHRALSGGFTILLTDFNLPFYDDILTPSGSLRDLKARAAIADLIVVSKCPSPIDQNKKNDLITKIKSYATAPVVFSFIKYLNPVNFFTKEVAHLNPKIVLLTSIANPYPLLDYLNSNSIITHHFKFPDHHYFTEQDVNKIISDYHFHDGVTQLVMTEKDAVKFLSFKILFEKHKIELIIVPINIYFNDDDTVFVKDLLDKYLLNA
jgi:tetraacyldisaccharide 4'-kinase